MNSWEIISLIINLIGRLYLIAKQVYDQVKNPYRQDMRSVKPKGSRLHS
jgi:hypothetical protein